jgi:hypothetical protein
MGAQHVALCSGGCVWWLLLLLLLLLLLPVVFAPADGGPGLSRPTVRVPSCNGGAPRATIDTFWVDDGSAKAAEATSVQLCWTRSHLLVRSSTVDSDLISSETACGSSTWDGDSLEIFMGAVFSSEEDARVLPEPKAWMEVDISQAGGMYYHVQVPDGKGWIKSRVIAKGAPGKCVLPDMSYRVWNTPGAPCPSGSSPPCEGWADEVEIPWSSFHIPEFKDVIDSWGSSSVPRQWRINFYRTNFFHHADCPAKTMERGCQHNPADFYAWHPSVPLGKGANFHRPVLLHHAVPCTLNIRAPAL